MVAAGEGAEGEQEAEGEGDEEAYGPGESALALMYEDDAGPDLYAGTDVDPANAPLGPMPTAVPPPPLGSCEQRQCRYHAAQGAHRHRPLGTGQREAGMLASALERYELQRPGQVAREVALVAASPDDGQVRCVQLGDAAVLGHHPGDVRAAEPQEGLPLSVRLSVGRQLDEAGLEDVRRDEGLYVALWQGGADAWRREQAVRPLTPQALGSHALLVAVHPEGAEVVFGADRLLLTGDGAVLVPTSSSYRLESRGGDLKLLVVVGTRLDESAVPQASEHAVPVGGDEEASRDGDEVGQEQPTGEGQEQDQPEVAGEEVDVQAIVAAALARFMDAAGPPPTTEALEEEDQRRRSKEAQVAMERNEDPEFKGEEAQSAVGQDKELEVVGAKEAREVGPRELGVADRAGPKTGEVETCKHWAKGGVHAGRCLLVRPPPAAGAAGSTPGITPDPPGHVSCGGSQPGPEPGPRPGPRNVAAGSGGKGARKRAPSGRVCGGKWGPDRVGSGVAMWHGGPAHSVTGSPVEGRGHRPGSQSGPGVHVAHTSCRHGPPRVAG